MKMTPELTAPAEPSREAVMAAEVARAEHQLGTPSHLWDDDFFTEGMRIALRAAYAVDGVVRPSVPTQEPDWFMCAIDPDEAGDSAHEAMYSYRPRLEPIELMTSYIGPTLWGVMSPPLPDADDDEETAYTFDTREEAEAFCVERRAIFAAIDKTKGGADAHRFFFP